MSSDLLNTHKEGRYIFVGGAPRSGTTLVQNILDSNPAVFGGPEFLHIPDIINLRNRLNASVKREHINLYCSCAEVDHITINLIKGFLKPILEERGVDYLSEKTPENILVFPELLELFPQAHLLFVIRDPRAIVASMIKVKARHQQKGESVPQFLRTIGSNIDYIKKCNRAGFAAFHDAPDRVLPVVYEKLVTHPEAETRRICDFIGLTWSEKMLRPGEIKHQGEQAITAKSGELWYDSATYYRNPETKHIDTWKASLTSWQQAMVTSAFREDQNLNRFGYRFNEEDYPLYQRIGLKLLQYSGRIRGKVSRTLYKFAY